MRVAHVMALGKLLQGTGDDRDRADQLRRALQDAATRPSEPDEDFARPMRRRAPG